MIPQGSLAVFTLDLWLKAAEYIYRSMTLQSSSAFQYWMLITEEFISKVDEKKQTKKKFLFVDFLIGHVSQIKSVWMKHNFNDLFLFL